MPLTHTSLFSFSLLLLILRFRHGSAAVDEIRSLLEFRKGIKSDPTNKVLSTWIYPSNASACPDAFHGVSCDAETSSVVSISLDRLGLAGDLKFSTLIPLKSLQNLTLAGNSLSGRLVPSLGAMSSLQAIDLSGNQFYGPIPARLTDLWSLHYVNLSSNRFSGFFPEGIRNLQQLRVLDLHSNQLEGDVRRLIPELRNVEYLDLSGNMFSGTIELSVENVSSLSNTVIFVDMSGNALRGGFWGNDVMRLFRNLRVLDLGDNGITGELPDFGQLPNLQVLRLGNNRLSGLIQGGILQEEVPLVELDLSRNEFSGPIPQISSTTLGTLNLSSNLLSGSLPPSIGNSRILDFSRNHLSDDISILTKWNIDLEILDLSSNTLTGSIPDFSNFQKLSVLRIRNNSLKGNLPLGLSSLQTLVTVDLSSNRLDGLIPPSLFTSTTLTNLNLSGNLFTGPIPLDGSHAKELLVLSSSPPMESLDLSNNLLTGRLPATVGNLGKLKSLNLAYNKLSGQLPHELSRLIALEYLNLSNNFFTGNIPDKLPSSLLFFDVSYNKLSGKIPENLYHFPDSSFSGNNLEPHNSVTSDNHVPEQTQNNRNHHRLKSSIRAAIILASIGAAVMIAFIVFAYRRARFNDFPARRRFCGQTSERDIKAGGFSLPSHLSLPDDHLLTSNSRSVSGQLDPADTGVGPSGRKPSPDSQIASSSHYFDTMGPAQLDVCSPDRFSGELFFLDPSIVFTAEELSRAPAEVLGRSSNGTLYKATLDSGHMLTVKWLRVGLVKQKKEFAKEVKKIGAMRHPSIVPLRAYYWGPREQERLVLADYIVGDSLAFHLYETTPRRHKPLTFAQRLKIATDISRGLSFLHNLGLPHGNLKPTNILLVGPDHNAQLTGHGLHRLMTPAGISEQILTLGAHGYRAPELAHLAKPRPSFKADVYALGVMLMELLTGRSAGDIISGQSGAVDLVDWVRLCDQEGRGLDCVNRDVLCEERYSEAVGELLGVSIRCVLPVNERPSMDRVLDDIRSIRM
ncbi:Probable inactive receptor kinase [Striga hermonthica]|uniref:Probable inactive receptor kinase n=1 Tax=Striga hermonthica TaxID=68872 RepID=A0A9N7RC79_STRHE|nr:Probable inactive receptor kinase [Striga hermonthica]